MTERKSYIDILKMLAMLFVFLIHTSDRFFLLFIQKTESPLYLFYICIPHLLKTCIPIFMMCSGVVLLGKKETLKVVLQNRFFRMLFILVIASLLVAIEQGNFELAGFLKKLYSSQYETTYWYMYMYLGFILMLPFLRMMAEKMQEEHYIYIVVIYSVLSLLKVIDFFVLNGKYALNENLNVFSVLPYVFSPLMGYYMVHKASKRVWSILTVSGLLFFVLAVASTYGYCQITQDFDKGHVQHFFETFVPLYSVSLFGIVQRFFRCPPSLQGALGKCSAAVLYMMLTEGFFRSRLENIYFIFEKRINPMLATVVWIAIAYTASLLASIVINTLVHGANRRTR